MIIKSPRLLCNNTDQRHLSCRCFQISLELSMTLDDEEVFLSPFRPVLPISLFCKVFAQCVTDSSQLFRHEIFLQERFEGQNVDASRGF